MPSTHRIPLIFKILAGLAILLAIEIWLAAELVPKKLDARWTSHRAELEAKGESLDYRTFLPAPIPDADNFFSDPIWNELTYRTSAEQDGFQYQAPVLPASEQKLNILRRPFTDEERQVLESEYPEFAPRDSTKSRVQTVREIRAKYSKTENETRAAGFTLEALAGSAPMMKVIRELVKRPDALFPLNYEDGMHVSVDHLAYLLAAGEWLAYHAEASLALGQSDEALREIEDLIRLCKVTRREPILLSHLASAALARKAVDAVRAGLRLHSWNEGQLTHLQGLLETLDLISPLARVLRFERALSTESVDRLLAKGGFRMLLENPSRRPASDAPFYAPFSVWIYRKLLLPDDKALFSASLQRGIDALGQYPGQPLDPSRFSDPLAGMKTKQKSRRIFTALTLPQFQSGVRRLAWTQTSIVQARVAIALEQYRLKNGHYPDSLASLVPGFLPRIPSDPVGSSPIQYRRKSSDKYALWSIGWNGVNDEGLPSKDAEKGDRVWEL